MPALPALSAVQPLIGLPENLLCAILSIYFYPVRHLCDDSGLQRINQCLLEARVSRKKEVAAVNLRPCIAGAWMCCGLALLPHQAVLAGNGGNGLPPMLTGERDRWAACVDGPARITLSPDTGLRRTAPLNIHADFMEYDQRTGQWELRGDVEMERADQRLRADRMQYDQPANRVDARGDLRYAEDGLKLGSSGGYMEMGRDRGAMDDVEYLLTESLAQGRSEHVEMLDAHRTRYTDATYSTCEPGNEFWQMRVSRMRLNQQTGVGEAWHARMAIRGVPVAYVPYVNFPIDDRRKSGLLPPTIQQSTRSGTDILLPVYWNIAPNYDATLAPRYLSRRGLGLESEFRFLQPNQSGELRSSILPDDDTFGDDRWNLGLEHRARLAPGLSSALSLNRVSDEDYFRDFGNNLDQSSRTFLPSQALINYRRGNIATTARAQVYQTVNPTISPGNEPHRRLPQVNFGYTPERADLGPFWLEHRVDAEAVRFDHTAPRQRDTGTRLDLTPRISVPLDRQAGYIRPSLAMRFTSYDLDRGEARADQDGTITRATPIASLDMGLYFDRFFTAFNRNLWQTFEPRLFYLYVPERNQDEIPLFDTGIAEPTLFQLFSEDRFLGADRVGDANQVTMGLTSRFINRDTGGEYFRVGVGQIFFFEDREVTLRPADEPDTRQRSDLIGEIRATLPAGFTADAEVHWDPDENRTNLSATRLTWQPEPRTIVSTGYRQRRDRNHRVTEQANVAAVLPIGHRWHAVGGWRYSLDEDRTLESFGGLEYRDCCWTIRLVNRYFREDAFEDAERSILLQFEFRGLGSIGDDIDSFLENTVFGYRGMR